jgi:hypothetical protein
MAWPLSHSSRLDYQLVSGTNTRKPEPYPVQSSAALADRAARERDQSHPEKRTIPSQRPRMIRGKREGTTRTLGTIPSTHSRSTIRFPAQTHGNRSRTREEVNTPFRQFGFRHKLTEAGLAPGTREHIPFRQFGFRHTETGVAKTTRVPAQNAQSPPRTNGITHRLGKTNRPTIFPTT